MKIHAIFGVYDGEGGGAELLDAWDECSMDSNPEGYQEKLEKLRRSKHISNVTEITLEVSDEDIRKAVFPAHATAAKVVT